MKVYLAINKVQAALAKEGITKNRKNLQQGYSFRGIDDIYNSLSPLLAEHGLCILPRVINRVCEERITKSGATLFYVTVEVEFDFVSSEDGSKHVVKTYGEAMDMADKATNKAMSAAFKYACLQAFAIPTEGDHDTDAVTQTEVIPKEEPKIVTIENGAMPENLMGQYLNLLTNADSIEKLSQIYKVAYKSAQKAHDNNSINTFTKIKDIRKSELNSEVTA